MITSATRKIKEKAIKSAKHNTTKTKSRAVYYLLPLNKLDWAANTSGTA